MFASITGDSNLQEVGLLREYFDRHIELDGDKHGPLGMAMIATLCGEDAHRWSEATNSAIQALQARSLLWDDVEVVIEHEVTPIGV